LGGDGKGGKAERGWSLGHGENDRFHGPMTSFLLAWLLSSLASIDAPIQNWEALVLLMVLRVLPTIKFNAFSQCHHSHHQICLGLECHNWATVPSMLAGKSSSAFPEAKPNGPPASLHF